MVGCKVCGAPNARNGRLPNKFYCDTHIENGRQGGPCQAFPGGVACFIISANCSAVRVQQAA